MRFLMLSMLVCSLGCSGVVYATPKKAARLNREVSANKATLPVEVTFGSVGHPYERDGGWGVNISMQIPGNGTRTRTLSCVPGGIYLLDGVAFSSPPSVLTDLCAYLLKSYGPMMQSADDKIGSIVKSSTMQGLLIQP